MEPSVVIIGGGVAGMTVAGVLDERGIPFVILEQSPVLGGHVGDWHHLFPVRRPAHEVLTVLYSAIRHKEHILANSKADELSHEDGVFSVRFNGDQMIRAKAAVLATGYDLFDARIKEEYGYGIYDNVITSSELEKMFGDNRGVVTSKGMAPGKVGLVHCVGSRDEKVGNLYCSKLCCVTGVKQAIEIRQMLPGCEITAFYMDLRMYDRHFEELYFEAQQKWGINFIRGRVSECTENPDHSILLKTEDTLTSRPLRKSVDLLILLTGMTPRKENKRLSSGLNLPCGTDGFLASTDGHLFNNNTPISGLFITGTVKGPAGITETIADARATAMQVESFLKTWTSQ